MDERIKQMDAILDESIEFCKVCPTCMDVQTHGLIYCKKCGGTYKQYKGLTLMRAIKMASQLPTKYKKVMVTFRPSYVAAVKLRPLRKKLSNEDKDITANEFTEYIEERLKNNEYI